MFSKLYITIKASDKFDDSIYLSHNLFIFRVFFFFKQHGTQHVLNGGK